MMALSSSAKRTLIRIAYLIPLFSGLILLIYACIPHLYFVHNNTAMDTLSVFGLVNNTFQQCSAITGGTQSGSPAATVFAYTMIFFAVLFWIALLVYAVMAITSAITSVTAFSYPPTSREANRAKRWMQFFCIGRAVYVIDNLLLLLAAAFPQILLHFYRTQMGYVDMSLHFFGPSDLLLAAILIALNLIAFLTLLPAQAEEHLDMFRLYKAKKDA